MNIVKFEFKNHLKFIIIWAVTIVLISALFLSFYPMLKGDISSFAEVMKNYPVVIQKMFGFNSELLKSALGYYASFAFTFIILFSAIAASILSFSILSSDPVKKSAEFLYTKPVSRQSIVVNKIVASLMLIILFNLIVIISNYVLLSLVGSFDLVTYLLVTLVLFFIQVSMFSIALLISLFIKVKTPIANGLGLTFMFYLGSVAFSNDVRFLIPFKYFDMLDIVMNKTYEVTYLFLVLFIFLISIFASIYVFEKKDL